MEEKKTVLFLVGCLLLLFSTSFFIAANNNAEISFLKQVNEKQLNEIVALTNETYLLKSSCDSNLLKANVETKKWIETSLDNFLNGYEQGLTDMDEFYACWFKAETDEAEDICYDELVVKQEAKGLE